MVLLFRRYASPFVLLDTVLLGGSLSEFISAVCEYENEEKEWQFFLHKIFDKSFDDFKSDLKPPQKLSRKDFETTVNHSKSILSGFDPRRKGEENEYI